VVRRALTGALAALLPLPLCALAAAQPLTPSPLPRHADGLAVELDLSLALAQPDPLWQRRERLTARTLWGGLCDLGARALRPLCLTAWAELAVERAAWGLDLDGPSTRRERLGLSGAAAGLSWRPLRLGDDDRGGALVLQARASGGAHADLQRPDSAAAGAALAAWRRDQWFCYVSLTDSSAGEGQHAARAELWGRWRVWEGLWWEGGAGRAWLWGEGGWLWGVGGMVEAPSGGGALGVWWSSASEIAGEPWSLWLRWRWSR
jgi:hypothetical protein